MSVKAANGWKIAAVLASLLAKATVAAAQGSAPVAGSAPAAVDAAALQRDVGYYKAGDTDIQAIVSITLSGTQLSMQPSGGPVMALQAQSATHFTLGGAPVSLDFVTDGKGPATAFIVHQPGPDVRLSRVDEATATAFNAKLAARIAAKTPQPGSQAAVADWIDHMQKGQPLDYTKMSPQLAEVVKAQYDQVSGAISGMGALQSLTFQTVEASGADTYLAKFLSGALLISIVIDSKGIITGMLLRPGP